MSAETGAGVAHRAAQLEAALRKIIRGKDDVIRLALVSMLARGHLLIEGVPGVGKTTLAHALARSLDCSFQRVQFTSDMLPSDVLGTSIFSAVEQKFEFKRGPVFTNVLLADEINRTTPKTQSALLEAMNEGQVTVDGQTYLLPQPFLVIATQNPVEHHGTYPLPESQLDRFLMRVRMGYPDANAEREILRSEAGAAKLENLNPVVSGADVLEMQQAVDASARGRFSGEVCLGHRGADARFIAIFARGFAARLANALPSRAGQRFLEWQKLLHPRRFQAVDRARVCAPRRDERQFSSTSTMKKSEQAEQAIREIVENVVVPV